MAGTGAQDEIRAVFDQLLQAQNTGDAEGVRSRLSESPDAVHIGTDADEWWTSKQIVDAVAAVGGGDEIQAVADDVGIHVQGDVAWVEGRGRFTAAGGGERPVRITGVFVREDGEWKVAQSHASIGVPNDEIFGQHPANGSRAGFDQLLQAQNTGDAEGVRSRLSESPDAVHIGTDADEWWTSKQIVDAVAAVGGGDEIQAVADDVGIHVQGDVAWEERANHAV